MKYNELRYSRRFAYTNMGLVERRELKFIS